MYSLDGILLTIYFSKPPVAAARLLLSSLSLKQWTPAQSSVCGFVFEYPRWFHVKLLGDKAVEKAVQVSGMTIKDLGQTAVLYFHVLT